MPLDKPGELPMPSPPGAMLKKAVQLLALIAVGLYLVPTGAHLFELPRKMGLSPEQYMTVQGIYTGWALFGVVIFAALVLTLAQTVLARGDPAAFKLTLAAFICLALTQAIFWAFTFPMNAATRSWTVLPENFEAARRQWEYSHAASAILTFAAFLALAVSTIRAGRRPAPSPPGA
jgi:hypothetical protein